MTERERVDDRKRKQEMIEDLARRFRDSANTLRSVARKLDEASRVRREARGADVAAVEARPRTGRFTYLEFLEFSSAEEFRKYRELGPVTEEEIASVDWHALSRNLLSE
jgi:hypothetical protein